MSSPDSFIDEVTEEVRRDRLFAIFRKYGWIGVLAILLIVGGASYVEWQKARVVARAQAFGDAVLDATDLGQPEERRAAIAAIPADATQKAVAALMLASDPADDKAGSLAALDGLINDTSQPQLYRDLAQLRRIAVAGSDLPLAERRAALEDLAVPGRAFRTLAQEQLAYLLVEEQKTDAAIAALAALMQDQEAPSGLRQRAADMITALGGVPPKSNSALASELPADQG
ncbi:MAG: hypothetical protein KBF27_01825 [Cypionkella sp.]|nr:hypothetical protein [Cypionkella sp.]